MNAETGISTQEGFWTYADQHKDRKYDNAKIDVERHSKDAASTDDCSRSTHEGPWTMKFESNSNCNCYNQGALNSQR